MYVGGFGWIPVDPADVRKVVLEEPPGNLPLTDAKVAAARKTLFGAWEMNWLAYNVAHDLKLPGSNGPAVEFLMYPQAETRRHAPRQPRSRQFQICDHGEGAHGLVAYCLAIGAGAVLLTRPRNHFAVAP